MGEPRSWGEIAEMLEGGRVGVVKSIQRITTTLDRNYLSPVIQIAPVNSSRSIVLLENLSQDTNQAMTFDYKLTDTTLEPFICTGTYSSAQLGFWIIEFY